MDRSKTQRMGKPETESLDKFVAEPQIRERDLYEWSDKQKLDAC